MFLLWQWCKYDTCNCTPTGVYASCPIELSPPSVVVKYGDPVSVNCSTSESLFEGIGWEATQGGTGLEQVNHLTWAVKSLTDWSISPSCYISPSQDSQFTQCSMVSKVVLYSKSCLFLHRIEGYYMTVSDNLYFFSRIPRNHQHQLQQWRQWCAERKGGT